MSKNLPYWGESAQPGKTYYLMKLVCDIFGIVDHFCGKGYTYICDELAAGSKSTDHTISFFQHFIDTYIPNWVQKLTICLDNARICKNRYLLGWASEVVESGRFQSIRFFYMTPGHTKFKPDRLFASIAKTFYERDVFCIEMLHGIAKLHSEAHTFHSSDIFQWRALLENKYAAVPGITSLRDFMITKESVQFRRACYTGSFESAVIKKDGIDGSTCIPDSYESYPANLTPEKVKHLAEQHDLFIKAAVEGYVRPLFLPPLQSVIATQQKRGCSQCDGRGHVDPGKKRHYSEKYCPVAKRQKK